MTFSVHCCSKFEFRPTVCYKLVCTKVLLQRSFERLCPVTMENKFVDKGVEIVTQAVQKDNAGEYSQALDLYKRSLEHFMIGMKCTCVVACIYDRIS